MTANEILNNYMKSCEEAGEGELDVNLKDVILDILKYLDYKESGGDADGWLTVPKYQDNLMWAEINKCSQGAKTLFIELSTLRKILEKYKIL